MLTKLMKSHNIRYPHLRKMMRRSKTAHPENADYVEVELKLG
jgi:hypothetical protein